MTIRKEHFMKIQGRVIQALCLFGLWLGVGLQAQAQTDTVTYVYTDPQGTPLVRADASGNVVAKYDYTPYGNSIASLGAAPNGLGYTGHVNDPETGLIYMQARYYQPTGRFLSPDPAKPAAGNIDNFNRYAYVNNNPIIGNDPSGMFVTRLGGDQIECEIYIHDGCGTESPEYDEISASNENFAGSNNTQGAPGKQGLNYQSFEGPIHEFDGSFFWKITWILTTPSTSGGYVVQEINSNLSGAGSNGKQINKMIHYWEAWHVSQGQINTDMITSQNYQFDDAFQVRPPGVGVGVLKTNASARFYEGLKLPSTFQIGNVGYAGDLPATYIDPHLPLTKATEPVIRSYTVEWPAK